MKHIAFLIAVSFILFTASGLDTGMMRFVIYDDEPQKQALFHVNVNNNKNFFEEGCELYGIALFNCVLFETLASDKFWVVVGTGS